MAGLGTAVRAYRYASMQELMRRRNYDALAFTAPDWFEWIANHELADQAFERPFVAVVTASGASFAVLSELSRNVSAACTARGESWIGSYHYYAESRDTSVHRWIAPQSSQLVAEVLRAAGLGRARIAVPSSSAWLARCIEPLPDSCFVEAGKLLQSLRWVKHPDEIATMRECAALTDLALGMYREQLRPGCLLEEADLLVAARLVQEAARRLPGQNFVIKSIRTISGAEAACAGSNGAPNGRTLEADAVALTALGTRLNGLAMELGRSWLVGRPDKSIVRLFDCALAAQRAAIEAVVAGKPVSNIHAAAQRSLDDAGLGAHLRLRAAHGLGVIQHDFPVDVPFEDRSLLEGEVYAVEPGLYIADVGGFRFADAVVAGSSAAEVLTRASVSRGDLTLG